MISDHERIRRLREAGEVKRAHIIPHIGEYSVAKHSYNAVTLLLQLSPSRPRTELIEAVLWHDAGERYVGDLPAPVKWAFPKLSEQYYDAEITVMHNDLGIKRLWAGLSSEETNWLAAVDSLEFWMWCLDQRAMGNQNVTNATHEIDNYIRHLIVTNRFPAECTAFFADYSWGRAAESPTKEDHHEGSRGSSVPE